MVAISGPYPSTTYFFFFNDTATTEIYTLSLHDALPISFWTRVISFFGYFPPNCSSEGWKPCCGRDRRCPEFRLPGLTERSGNFLKRKAGSLSAFLFRSAALSLCLR